MKTKGQIGAFQGAILSLVVIGILLGAGFLIFAEFQYESLEKGASGTTVNETVDTTLLASGITLNAGSLIDGACGTITAVYNATTHEEVDSADYTQTGCSLINATSLENADTEWKVNYPYSYSASTKASNSTANVSEALEKIPNMLGLVILIIVIGVILGIVFAVIPTRTA